MRLNWTVRWAGGAALVACTTLHSTTGAAAQATPSAPADLASEPIPWVDSLFRFDGSIEEWRGLRPSVVLPAAERRPQAIVWWGQLERGLAIAAEIRGGAAGIAPGSRLRVRLTDPTATALPPIGWGHQFGFETVEGPEGCSGFDLDSASESSCQAWVERQAIYRDAVSPLLAREWEIPLAERGRPTERLVAAALARLDSAMRSEWGRLAGPGRARAASTGVQGAPGVRSLELTIPWAAGPPVRAPRLEAVELGLTLSTDAGFATAPVSRSLAGVLVRPLEIQVTACDLGASELRLGGDALRWPHRASADALALFRPESSGRVGRLYVLDHDARGYQYAPFDDSRAPRVYEARFFERELEPGRWLCGPALTYRDLTSSDSAAVILADSAQRRLIMDYVYPDRLEVRASGEDGWLVLSGPWVHWTYFGSGQCGACPRVGVEILHVERRTGRITPAFSYLEVVDSGVDDIEIAVAPDWSEITVFESTFAENGSTPSWKANRFCRTEGGASAYEACGTAQPVEEPPRALRGRILDGWRELESTSPNPGDTGDG